MLRRFFVSLVLLINTSYVYAGGMSQQQIDALLERIGRHFENGYRATQIDDRYTACSEGREALRLFNQIDPNDILPADRGDYERFREGIIGIVKKMNRIC